MFENINDNRINITIEDKYVTLTAEFKAVDSDANDFARVLKGMLVAFDYRTGDHIMTDDDLEELYEEISKEIRGDEDQE
jgi:hypothetical protein